MATFIETNLMKICKVLYCGIGENTLNTSEILL